LTVTRGPAAETRKNESESVHRGKDTKEVGRKTDIVGG